VEAYEKLSQPTAFAVFVFTLVLPILVGLIAMRRTRTASDFLVGGRTMDRVVVALSAVSSGRSSWLVLGLSGMAYKMGVGAVWAVVGYVTVEMVQFVFVGRKLRRESARTGSLTLLDYLEARAPGRGHALRICGAVIIGLFLTAYVAAQFNAGAKSLGAALDIPLAAGLGIAGALVMVYMVLGGFVAVAYNDVVRAVIMIVGLVVLPVVGLIQVGGLDSLLATVHALDPARVDPLSIGAGALIGFVGIGLGSPGQPHIVVRYMSVSDADKLRSSAVIGTLWNVVLGWGAVFIGLLGRALVPEVGDLPDGDPEMVYLALSARFFDPLMYGLLVGGIFAAILSTADSQLLVVASTAVRDVYEQVLRAGRPLDEKTQLRLNRIVVVIAGLVALLAAYLAKDLVFWLVLFAWAGLGAAFGPALILSLFWKRTSRAGIIAGMLAGAETAVWWKQAWYGQWSLKGATGVYELLVAFPAALLAVVLISLIAPDPRRGEAAGDPGSVQVPGDGGAQDPP